MGTRAQKGDTVIREGAAGCQNPPECGRWPGKGRRSRASEGLRRAPCGGWWEWETTHIQGGSATWQPCSGSGKPRLAQQRREYRHGKGERDNESWGIALGVEVSVCTHSFQYERELE